MFPDLRCTKILFSTWPNIFFFFFHSDIGYLISPRSAWFCFWFLYSLLLLFICLWIGQFLHHLSISDQFIIIIIGWHFSLFLCPSVFSFSSSIQKIERTNKNKHINNIKRITNKNCQLVGSAMIFPQVLARYPYPKVKPMTQVYFLGHKYRAEESSKGKQNRNHQKFKSKFNTAPDWQAERKNKTPLYSTVRAILYFHCKYHVLS